MLKLSVDYYRHNFKFLFNHTYNFDKSISRIRDLILGRQCTQH